MTNDNLDNQMQISDLRSEPDLTMVNEAYRMRSTDRIKSFLALECFAAKGSKASLLYISDMFARGIELDDIHERAKRWNELAKAAHLSKASLFFGKGFDRIGDYSSAFDAFSWGATDGYAPSIYRLASMYLLGGYVKKDYRKARELLEIAAKMGNVWAKKDLAHVLLFNNFGILGKLQGVCVFFNLFYYQIDILMRKTRNIPLDEKYFQ